VSAVRAIASLLLGAFLVALSFNWFLNDFDIASGGVSGISVIFEDLFGIRPAFTQWFLNVVFFVLGYVLLGRQFAAKTLVGTFVLPLFVFLTEDWPTITDEPLLAAVFGGLGVGLGLGLVFRARASTGGTDLLAQIVHRFTGISLGAAVLLLDGLIVFCAGVVYGPERALYALIALFVTGKTIDLVQLGLGMAKMAFIISENQDKMKQAILRDLDRGVTLLPAYGGYTDRARPILLCVVEQTELARLKELVSSVDERAFVIVANASEVLGEGFRGSG
jgi:uncharacterized membrane-anchored protein YitT (DUF2179 family)